MKKADYTIYVYADWMELEGITPLGQLFVQQKKGRKAFSFEYNKQWIDNTKALFLLDPDLALVKGRQYPRNNKENFGIFLDSMPDRWGRKLMQRRENILAKKEARASKILYDIDFLLGVFDPARLGGLRFKLHPDKPFLNNEATNPIPSWAALRKIQVSAAIVERNDDNKDIEEHIQVLIAPGTSLGGARPKSNVLDENGHPWIAKFPSKNDPINKGAWEYLAYLLATEVGIQMATSKIEHLSPEGATFITKRFDRQQDQRIHFASAMTLLGYNEQSVKDYTPSYLELAEFIATYSGNVNEDLKELWTRIAFSIAISNTDDHLRNHGFIVDNYNWRLSPAYDLNPSIDKTGLALNIDEQDNRLDFDLLQSVGLYFRLGRFRSDVKC